MVSLDGEKADTQMPFKRARALFGPPEALKVGGGELQSAQPAYLKIGSIRHAGRPRLASVAPWSGAISPRPTWSTWPTSDITMAAAPIDGGLENVRLTHWNLSAPPNEKLLPPTGLRIPPRSPLGSTRSSLIKPSVRLSCLVPTR